ncbi:hypothetical protein HIM_11322 [Hirsutella minnesotensis 3608]|uniref:Actin-like ATPase domain-containing protein n=1 Tax=Hirsutella minnesotensis 3608 TaxID=1043627 RepID=A0A0F7ZFK2_9HYPO|nr:hypothetical protein HIM_11322 [Hirsutella minnesotensis 3608]
MASTSSTDRSTSIPRIGYGIDFGSSSIRVAIRQQEEPPQVVTGWDKGETRDAYGKAVAAYQYPTDIAFREKGKFEILGCRHHLTSEETASGVKQSLDEQLCRDGEGMRFIHLCQKYEVQPSNDVHDVWQVDKVTVAIPAIWAQDSRGIAIQDEFSRVAVQAGFPPETIDFEVEPICILGSLQLRNKNLWLKYGGKKGFVRVVVDIGASTIDAVAAIVDQDQFAVISEPLGDSGGMANAWRDLREIVLRHCKGDIRRADTVFLAARHDFFKMPLECHDVEIGDVIIKATDFREIRKSAFKKPLEVIRRAVMATPNLDLVYVVGGASASNDGVQALIREELNVCRYSLQERGVSFNFKVEFQSPDEAAVAVCLGAALPWPIWEPESVFRLSWFGIICKRDGNNGPGRPPTRIPVEHDFLLTMKEKGSDNLEESFETLVVDEPTSFTISPAYDSFGDPVKSHNSPDTGRSVLPLHYRTIFMDPIVCDLSDFVNPHDKVRARFKRRQHINLFTLQIECEKENLQERHFVLDRDRTRLRFIERTDVASSIDDVYDVAMVETTPVQVALGSSRPLHTSSEKRPGFAENSHKRIKRHRQSYAQRVLGIMNRQKANARGIVGTPLPRGRRSEDTTP